MLIPPGPDTLTPTWLTGALRAGGAIDSASVVSFTASPLTQGLYGQTVRLDLRYDRGEGDGPPTLIAKFSSATRELRQRAIDSYAKEIHFYRELAPRSTLPTPACYYADIDLDTCLHVLLLEDLAPARSGVREKGCSRAQAAQAVEHVAAFHAVWWEHPSLPTMDWLPDPDFGGEPDRLQEEYDAWWLRFLERVPSPLPQAVQEIGENFGPHRARIESHLFNAPPRTLLHGDYHLGNLLFATPAGRVPFAVVDWQMLRRGRGVRDVAYFLSENLLPDERRTIETTLLETYHRILVTGGVEDYSFADCLYDYRLALLQRFRALVSTIAVMPFTGAERQMHIDILLPRNMEAILDHDAGALLLA